jgi:hypothetical protein
MIGEEESRLTSSAWTKALGRDGLATDEVRPAIPRSGANFEEQVGGVSDRPASAVICTLISREQATISKETKPIGVAYPPSQQLEL